MKIASQWRFRKDMIDSWLERGMTGEEPVPGPPPSERITLEDCTSEDYVLTALDGRTKLAAIQEIAGFAESVGVVRDATWFAGALLERENMLSTAVERGAAFLHARHRNRHKTVRPFILVARSAEGIEWDAPDGQLSSVFFVLGLKFDSYHLYWLTQLSRMVLLPGLLDRVREAESPAEVCRALKEAFREVAPDG
jgi:mannitol/fructose-specific phosphotransferase system IIA component (Ntr-type)